MALVASPPSRIAFFCQLPAASGGETSLLHSQELYRRALLVSPQFMARLAAEGLLYKRTLSREDDPSSAQGRGWLSTYAADGHERASVEAAMRASGVSGWEWRVIQRRPDGGLCATVAGRVQVSSQHSNMRAHHHTLTTCLSPPGRRARFRGAWRHCRSRPRHPRAACCPQSPAGSSPRFPGRCR